MSKFFLWFLGFIVLLLFAQAVGLWQKSFFPVSGMFFVFSFLVIFFEKPLLALPISFFTGLFLDIHSGLAFLSFTFTLFLICILIDFSKKFFEAKNVIYFLFTLCFSFFFFSFFPHLFNFLFKLFARGLLLI